MRFSPLVKFSLVGLAIVGVALGATVSATHLVPIATSCTYEVGASPVFASVKATPSAPVTGDGYVQAGGCVWDFVDFNPSCFKICLDQGIPVSGQYASIQAVITDSVFGSGVGALLCTDVDDDGTCGDASKGESATSFCGASPVVTSTHDNDGDGHADHGARLFVIIDGPLNQLADCGPTGNPVGGVHGTITVVLS